MMQRWVRKISELGKTLSQSGNFRLKKCIFSGLGRIFPLCENRYIIFFVFTASLRKQHPIEKKEMVDEIFAITISGLTGVKKSDLDGKLRDFDGVQYF